MNQHMYSAIKLLMYIYMLLMMTCAVKNSGLRKNNGTMKYKGVLVHRVCIYIYIYICTFLCINVFINRCEFERWMFCRSCFLRIFSQWHGVLVGTMPGRSPPNDLLVASRRSLGRCEFATSRHRNWGGGGQYTSQPSTRLTAQGSVGLGGKEPRRLLRCTGN